MKKLGILLIFTALLLFNTTLAPAQSDAKLHPANSNITIEEDSYVVPKAFFDFIITDHKRLKELTELHKERSALADSINALRQNVVAVNNSLLKIQQDGLDKYKTIFNESINVSEQAMIEIRKARSRAYVTATLTGFGLGGLAVGAMGDGNLEFSFPGAIAGMAVGVGLNYLVNKFF